jgi:2-amino-4-hydroxy-6-hydroxymethyldihydropteridine diphosphokinase
MTTVRVAIALGSNVGERQELLAAAVAQLAGCLVVDRLSDVYETEPAYVEDQPRFLNMVLAGYTELPPHDLLACLKRIERDLGRVAGRRWGPRPIDLDIVLYGSEQIDTPDLTVPHPRFAERPFVLSPLAEILPDLIPPGFERTIRQLAANAPAIGSVLSRLGPLNPRLDRQSIGVDE